MSELKELGASRDHALTSGSALEECVTVRDGYLAGLERAAQLCEAEIEAFLSPEYSTGQPLSSIAERFACKHCADVIRESAAIISKAEGAS